MKLKKSLSIIFSICCALTHTTHTEQKSISRKETQEMAKQKNIVPYLKSKGLEFAFGKKSTEFNYTKARTLTNFNAYFGKHNEVQIACEENNKQCTIYGTELLPAGRRGAYSEEEQIHPAEGWSEWFAQIKELVEQYLKNKEQDLKSKAH